MNKGVVLSMHSKWLEIIFNEEKRLERLGD